LAVTSRVFIIDAPPLKHTNDYNILQSVANIPFFKYSYICPADKHRCAQVHDVGANLRTTTYPTNNPRQTAKRHAYQRC
jgi:hypothetical protein